jgi:ribonuclease Z
VIEVVTLGTGSPIPDPHRAGPATLVRVDGTQLLFDCGRAVVMRLAGAGSWPVLLDAVLLTHLHSDHTTDLDDVITTRWIMSPTESPLPVVGPPGTASFVERALAMLTDDVGYRRAHHADLTWDPSCEVSEVLDGLAWESDGIRVTAAPTDHRPVAPTVGYRIEAGDRVIAIAGDTVPCAGLDRICADADVYVQTVLRDDLVRAVPNPRVQDVLDYHSTCEDAGRTAQRAGVRMLVLNHPVPPPPAGTEDEWVAAAAARFHGEIVLAHDLWSTTLA